MAEADPILAKRRLSVRLARNFDDMVAVQRLRGQVFIAEMGAGGPSGGHDLLDGDVYDPLCDHLLVIDETPGEDPRVVGTYRLLRESVAGARFGFYSAGEFDLSPIVSGRSRPAGQLLELGRSCVLPAYRTSATIQLLWRGIAEYVARHRVGLLFGCASFPGTDPERHAMALSLIHHEHLAPPEHRPVAHAGKGIPLEQLPRGSYDPRQAVCGMPPLVKGYLRAGARFGEGAYIDREFNTIDVCVVLPVSQLAGRYAARFSSRG